VGLIPCGVVPTPRPRRASPRPPASCEPGP
jgi:hypothetical protein